MRLRRGQTGRKVLTHERLVEALSYDPESGLFTWRVRTSIRVKAGARAGTERKDGYSHLGLDGKRYMLHRLAYFYQHREWPTGDVDHINGIKSDNRACNLRAATRSENMQNRCEANANNASTGVLGVYKVGDRFRAKIEIDRKSRSLGYFSTITAAACAYAAAKAKMHPASARLSGPKQ